MSHTRIQISNSNAYIDSLAGSGTLGQYLKSTGLKTEWATLPASSWVGTATSNLDMATNSISNCSRIITSAITNSGIYIDSIASSGTLGQYLKSTGYVTEWATLPASTWVGTATSNLDMVNNAILNCLSIDTGIAQILTIGKFGGTVNVNSVMNLSGPLNTGAITTTNIDAMFTGGDINIGANYTAGVQIGNNDGCAVNLLGTTVVTGPLEVSGLLTANGNITTPSINTSGIVNIGGYEDGHGMIGSTGDYLSTNGIVTAWTALPSSSWVGTATSPLNMATNAISNCSSLTTSTLINSGGYTDS